jgi:hypothetical protein
MWLVTAPVLAVMAAIPLTVVIVMHLMHQEMVADTSAMATKLTAAYQQNTSPSSVKSNTAACNGQSTTKTKNQNATNVSNNNSQLAGTSYGNMGEKTVPTRTKSKYYTVSRYDKHQKFVDNSVTTRSFHDINTNLNRTTNNVTTTNVTGDENTVTTTNSNDNNSQTVNAKDKTDNSKSHSTKNVAKADDNSTANAGTQSSSKSDGSNGDDGDGSVTSALSDPSETTPEGASTGELQTSEES